MNNRAPKPQPAGLSLGDIYYTLFRHKWLIIGLAAAGILTAMGIYFMTPQMYQSEAKVLLRYILENKTANPSEANAQVKNVDSPGASIINAELEILNSLDLAEQVVDIIGPKEILAKIRGGTNRIEAAYFICKHIQTTTPGKGNIIKITFEHPDPNLPQKVLQQLLDSYYKRHAEIHRAPGLLEDALAQQIDQLRVNLTQIEDELRKTKAKAGVTTLEETKKTSSEQINRIVQEILTGEAELAERQAGLKEFQRLSPAQIEALAIELGVSQEKIKDYKNLCSRLEAYRNRERYLLVQNTEENPIVTRLREQIAETDKLKTQLEKEYPKLVDLYVRTLLNEKPGQTGGDPLSENARVSFLRARTNVLNMQLERIRTEATKVSELESTITQLERKKNLAETNYYYYSTSLEQSHMAEARGPGKVTNITPVQSPTPPALSPGKLAKPIAMAVLGGLLGGIALAFLLELYVDQTVKRPVDVETKLGLPMFLTIPKVLFNGHPRVTPQIREGASTGDAQPSPVPQAVGGARPTELTAIAPWDPNHNLRSYFDALRDRLITYFEINNMTHKPKLLAVAGCSKGAGVSTIAAGLAASLSETGDGNVLLVDMNLTNGAAHPFFKGRPASGLMDVLGHEKREAALVQENLYVASANEMDDRLPRVLPKRISQLVPKFKASDYDYIIFDMPLIDQRSITPRLASLMDMTLLVLESEKTQRDTVKQAGALLTESGGKFRALLNKHRTYVPRRLHQDF